jgi:3-oxosteroid 1-dehydrogenase
VSSRGGDGIIGRAPDWDDEADLVVLGSGGAALTGALVAAVEGAEVVVLEKAALVGGTTSISGGVVWIPVNHHMAEAGVDDSREEALAYVRALVDDPGEDELLTTIVDTGAPMIRFLEERAGLSFRPFPTAGPTLDYRSELPGAKHGGRSLDAGKVALADLGEWGERLRTGPQSAWLMDKLEHYSERMHAWPPRPDAPRRMREAGEPLGDHLASGSALIGQLLRACLEQGVTIHVEAPGEHLVLEDGRVTGVQARRDGEPYLVRARGGVLIATGGYSQNEELKRIWLDRPLLGTCEIAENQGDGHLMGMAVGAQLAGLGDAWWSPRGAMPRQLPHSIIVNADGRRFVNEAQNYNDLCEAFGTKTGQSGAKNLPAWVVFDSQGCESYAAFARTAARARPTLPPPGERAADAGGLDAPSDVVAADTLTELAEAIGVDATGLVETVERFNGFARAGDDADFGRGRSRYDREWGDLEHEPNPSLGTIERGPFYAGEIYPGSLATKGGLRINVRAEVLSAATGGPIPGLYAAGNCSSGVWLRAYPGLGGTLGPAMVFGYIAALEVTSRVRDAIPA